MIILEIRLESSDLIWGINFEPPISPSSSTHLLIPSSSYPWLPMVVSLFLTHLLLEVASPITFPPPFRFHWSSWCKGLHWWRRFKAYKLYMELHNVVSEHLHLGDVLLLPLSFISSIHIYSLFFIVFSMYLLNCLVVWCYLEEIQKNKLIKS